MTAYYNEHDADKATWLRELIKAGLIAPGEVDERDIQDVLPRELAEYTQCHFFAGIGIWSYALRRAGWPDSRPVWTGSCPCQPFSAAGKRGGFADERHLWPAWYHLISINRPDVVFGEQTAKRHGFAWLDLVQSDLEAAEYAVGALCLPACGFGAPHLRERIFFVADTLRAGWTERRSIPWDGPPAGRGESDELADAHGVRRRRRAEAARREERTSARTTSRSDINQLGDAESDGRLRGTDDEDGRRGQRTSGQAGAPGFVADADCSGCAQSGSPQSEEWRRDSLASGRGPTNGFWRDAEWIYCRDDKYRPTQPGIKPLAHGAAARILRLRGYGDGIVAPVAQAFIEAYMAEREVK